MICTTPAKMTITKYSKIDCSSKSEAGIIGVYLLGHRVRNECGQLENQFTTLLIIISTIEITYITR